MIILLLDSMLSLAILERFLYVYVTQTCMKETFGDDRIEVLIKLSACDNTCMKWQGTRFAHKLALEKL